MDKQPTREVFQMTIRIKRYFNASAGLFLMGFICAGMVFPLPLLAGEPVPQSLVGNWEGVIDAANLKVVFHIAEKADQTLSATLDSPDQKAFGIPVETVVFEKGHLHLEIPLVHGSYDGQMNEDGSEMDGKWKQGLALALNLKKTSSEPGDIKPSANIEKLMATQKAIASHEPQKPYPYQEEAVSFPNIQAGVTLAGTLTLPEGEGPFPAVVLISGSGPNDRDETVAGHRLFLEIADDLTRHGIAVLRYDKRGIKASTGDYFTATTQDFASDALSGVAYLKSREGIDPKKIGLVGHSEGGLIAPMAAIQAPDVSFIVLLAGSGVAGKDVILRQRELMDEAEGVDKKAMTFHQASLKWLLGEIEKGKDEGEIKAAMPNILQAAGDDPQTLSKDQAFIDSYEKLFVGPWGRFFITFDPQETLRKVKCPVLALNGEKDLQVDPQQNLPPIEEALKEGNNPDVTFKSFPDLNHLFLPCNTGDASEYALIPQTISPAVLGFMTAWIKKHTGQ